jgi:hypothetical protein
MPWPHHDLQQRKEFPDFGLSFVPTVRRLADADRETRMEYNSHWTSLETYANRTISPCHITLRSQPNLQRCDGPPKYPRGRRYVSNIFQCLVEHTYLYLALCNIPGSPIESQAKISHMQYFIRYLEISIAQHILNPYSLFNMFNALLGI